MTRPITKKQLADLWAAEFVSTTGLCGLCGNTGWIDTRRHLKSPAGVACGIFAACICPNGRAQKAATQPGA